ncbi:MAG: hypothetical protein PUF55_02180 [Bacteroidales bacterium]|nr:hypothetical protein [Bacteroidales bacterium]
MTGRLYVRQYLAVSVDITRYCLPGSRIGMDFTEGFAPGYDRFA